MYTIELRRGFSADWAAKNPILKAGEPGVEIDRGQFKIGDGVRPWLDLPYYSRAGNSPLVFTWDGLAYQPIEFITDLTRQKWFTGPVDPVTVGAVLALYDQWIDTS